MVEKLNTPLVSVLVPVYNVSEYLRQCLDSLVNQTLSDIEIICVNDGSTDDSLDILKEYAAHDARIKIIDKTNGGLPSARNAGLDAAIGKYIGFVDADDYVDTDMFRKMYCAAKDQMADIVVCGAHCFPMEDEAPIWLKDVLTTRDVVYNKPSVEVIFEEKGAKPFLWRNLVSKSLIDKYNFRLDESIIVGEDQAMQFKMFPKASKVAFISDKLYFYRYIRTGSIMNAAQYKDYGIRLQKHIRMIDSIAKSWVDMNMLDENAVKFFDWAIDFIYWDMIKVSVSDRAQLCKSFCDIVIKYGYFKYCKFLSGNTTKFFEYMYKQCGQQFTKPKLSVVIAMGNCKDYLSDCLNSILHQTMQDVEVLIYDNAADPQSYKIAEEYLYKDARVSLHRSEWQPISSHYNDAILSAKGDYISFVKPYDYYENKNCFADAIGMLERNSEVDLVGFIANPNNDIDPIVKCQCEDFYSFTYRIDKIKEHALEFSDYALLTGRVFFTKYCLLSNKVGNLGYKPLYRNQTLKRVSIYADEARLILKAMVYMLEVASANGLDLLRKRIGEMLNSENYERLITDATYGFDMNSPKIDNVDKKTNADIFGLLVKANQMVLRNNQANAMIKTLSRFIELRHEFLEKY